ncbi:hypothetical protein KCMC57_up54750 [Kitasatospora sp. CMC57]|uniref:Uncharacterized protein n=1 Tax=Kitasatospora sp. CMC57 TaxID=3231513 RepID=A0AB33K5Z6_9ACTN
MSGFAVLATTIAGLYAETDDGSGSPQRVSGHEADRLATLPRHEPRRSRSVRRPRFTVRRTA